MSFVVRLRDYRPIPRDVDQGPWTQALIEQSPLEPIAWSIIDTQGLSPLDEDPLHPALRSFTTVHATENPGLYRVVFRDADGNVSETEPLRYPAIGVAPGLDEIAAINLARTEDARGNPLGTFTDVTKPTGDVVEMLAWQAGDWIVDELGPDIPTEFVERARKIAAMYAAALVEATAHEPRQSVIDLWTKGATDARTALAARMTEVGSGETEGPEADRPGPVYSFPPAPAPQVF